VAKSIQPPAASSADSDRDLARQYQKGDTAARDQLFERHLPLARRLATRYRHSNEDLEDLVQVAGIALLNAIERFDPERGTDFTSYAIPTVLGELKRHFRDHTWSVHVPRDLQERSLKISRTIDELGTELGRSPTISEVATKLELSVEDALDAMRAADAYDALSFEAESTGLEGEGRQLSETVGKEDPHYELVDYAAAIEDTLTDLPERERVVLYLRFVEDLTQTQIAERIGVSQMHVSRLIRRAVSALRESAQTTEEG
jgi:RNA polymerase sigma-B factor